jgi:hypothetical protein
MKSRTAVLVLCAAAVLGTVVQCGGSSSSPTTTPTPVPTVAPPAASAPPTGGIALPPGMVCNPTPPPLYGFRVGPHAGTPDRVVLDSKPLVVNVDGYCERVGMSGRFCETRLEGNDQRVACDYLAVGQARDTGRWGPTWYYNGQLCGNNFAACANHGTEQFLVAAKEPGKFEACAAPNAPVHPDGGPCGGCDLDATGKCMK